MMASAPLVSVRFLESDCSIGTDDGLVYGKSRLGRLIDGDILRDPLPAAIGGFYF